MTAPTQPVTIRLADFGGPDRAGVKITLRPSGIDYTADGTVISDEPVVVTTDASGVAVANVFPNALAPSGLGTMGTTIRVTAPLKGGRGLDVQAAIPNAPCNLVDHIVDQEPNGLGASERAASVAQSARDSALSAAADALTYRDQTNNAEAAALSAEAVAVSAAGTATAQAQTAVDQATTAVSAAVTAVAARDTALGAAHMYTNTAAALADATLAVGAYFTTPSGVAGEAAILYQKTAGPTATDTGVRLPSTALVPQNLPPESGYVWALTGAGGRAALLVAIDGTVTIPKYTPADGAISLQKLSVAVQSRIGQDLSADSGFVWGVVDAAGAIALGVKTDGSLVTKLSKDTTGINYLQPSKNIFYMGDSLTAGAGGQITWREVLTAALTDRSHTSIAIGGQTSTQIVARAGAYVTLLTVAGNQIPGSGSVAVTARTIALLTDQGTQSISGWLGGVYGTLARAADDSYTFTRAKAGSAVNVGVKMPFAPDIGTHDFDTLMIFMGRNNLTSPSDVQRDIAAAVALQKTAEKRFLILTPTNGGTLTSGASTSEGTGSTTLANIKTIEDWAVQTYGDRVLKLREYSFQFNNGSADDLDDVAKETVPRSLRIDGVHFTTAFHAQVEALVLSELTRRGW